MGSTTARNRSTRALVKPSVTPTTHETTSATTTFDDRVDEVSGETAVSQMIVRQIARREEILRDRGDDAAGRRQGQLRHDAESARAPTIGRSTPASPRRPTGRTAVAARPSEVRAMTASSAMDAAVAHANRALRTVFRQMPSVAAHRTARFDRSRLPAASRRRGRLAPVVEAAERAARPSFRQRGGRQSVGVQEIVPVVELMRLRDQSLLVRRKRWPSPPFRTARRTFSCNPPFRHTSAPPTRPRPG